MRIFFPGARHAIPLHDPDFPHSRLDNGLDEPAATCDDLYRFYTISKHPIMLGCAYATEA